MKTTSAAEGDARAAILATGQGLMARKGFSAVGLTEILGSAGVPKGSFYHYFASKDAFGEAMLVAYFSAYHAEMDATLARPDLDMAGRLLAYWEGWRAVQGADDCQGRCLAVKLGAEVADLSEAMRLALKDGTAGIVARLASAIEAGVADGTLAVSGAPGEVAANLYNLWLGSSVMAKVLRHQGPFDGATRLTRQLLGLPAA